MGSPGTSPIPLTVGPSPVPGPVPAPAPQQITNAPQALSRKHPNVAVLIETRERGNEFAPSEQFDWRNITFAMDGGDTTATITAGLDAGKLTAAGALGTEHLSHLVGRLSPDRRVRIAQSFGASRSEVYFQGYPQVPSINWTERGQSVSCLCLCEGQETLRVSRGAQVYGRRMRWAPMNAWQPGNPDDFEVTALPPVFNAGNLPNRSAEVYTFERDGELYAVHLFTEDEAPDAARWSFAEALRYVLFFHVLRLGLSVSVGEFLADTSSFIGMEPLPQSLDPFVRRMSARVEDISVASMSVEEAIHQLIDAAGLHYEVGIRTGGADVKATDVEFFLRVFATLATADEAARALGRTMIAPKVHDIAREAPFTDVSGRTELSVALANRVTQASLTLDKRAVNAPIFLGGHGEYEVTLLLRPGWLPHAQLDNLSAAQQVNAKLFWENQFADDPFPDPDSRMPASQYHPSHPYHWRVADIGRYWMFPDDHRWINSDGSSDYERVRQNSNSNWPAELYNPLNMGNPDDRADPADPRKLVLVRDDVGGDITDAARWIPRRRLFREMIGRVRNSGGTAPIVRINFKATDPYTALESSDWVPFTGKSRIDERRAGIFFEMADLWGAPELQADPTENPRWGMNMLRAYIEGHFMVAVTCVIRGDERMVYGPPPGGASFRRHRHQVVDLGLERFRYRNRRGQNSHLNVQENDADPAFEDRDDTEKLEAYGRREAGIMAGDVVSGSLETFWIDPTTRLGDSYSGASGMGIDFNRYPVVVRKEYVRDPAAGYRTVVHLSDLRGSPEVGVE